MCSVNVDTRKQHCAFKKCFQLCVQPALWSLQWVIQSCDCLGTPPTLKAIKSFWQENLKLVSEAMKSMTRHRQKCPCKKSVLVRGKYFDLMEKCKKKIKRGYNYPLSIHHKTASKRDYVLFHSSVPWRGSPHPHKKAKRGNTKISWKSNRQGKHLGKEEEVQCKTS